MYYTCNGSLGRTGAVMALLWVRMTPGTVTITVPVTITGTVTCDSTYL